MDIKRQERRMRGYFSQVRSHIEGYLRFWKPWLGDCKSWINQAPAIRIAWKRLLGRRIGGEF